MSYLTMPESTPGLAGPLDPILGGVEATIGEILTVLRETNESMQSVQNMEKQIDLYTPPLIGALCFIGVGLFAVAITNKKKR